MSTPDAEPNLPETAPRARLLLALRALAGFAALASLLSLWFSERARVLDDLQLSAEVTARPGETLALRAFYLKDVEAPEGPSLVIAPTRVRLLDARDRELARTELTPGRGDVSMEGRLRLPETRTGGLWLEARAQLHGRTPLVCRRGLLVSADAPNLVARPREAMPLQQQSLGALRGARADDLALLPRVLGGACMPEQRCSLLVWVGGQGASVTLRPDAAVRLEQIAPPGPTRGFVEIALRVHGPEASVVLEARRDAEIVAERTLRLPVALGEAQLSLARALQVRGEAAKLDVQLPPGRSSGILDVFGAGRWRYTQSFLSTQGLAVLSLTDSVLGAGLVRIQAHTDRFSGEGAGARLVFIREPGASDVAALAQIALAVRGAGLDPAPWDAAAGALPGWLEARDYPAAARFMLAGLEGLRVPLPRAVSARPFELARLARAQNVLRFGVGLLLVLCAAVVGLTLMRSGLRAQGEADLILAQATEDAAQDASEDAGDESDEVRNKSRRPGVYLVVSLVLAVGLAFLLAALLIVAKPLWF